MATAQLKTVQRAAKDQGECSKCHEPLPKGCAYRYYRPGFRSRVKIRVCMKTECTPRQSELDSSKLSDALAAIESARDEIEAAETVEAVREALETCAGAINDVAQEYEDAIEAAPMLEDQLRDKIGQLEDFSSELEGIDLEDEPDQPVEDAEPEREKYDDDVDGDRAFEDAHDEWLNAHEAFPQELEDWKQECEDALQEAKEAAKDALDSAEF